MIKARAYPSVSTWKEYTVSVSASTPPTKGTIVTDRALWRREGDQMRIIWTYIQSSSGSSGVGDYNINIPRGHIINTNIIPVGAGTRGFCGHFSILVGSLYFNGTVSCSDNTHLIFTYTRSGDVSGTPNGWGSSQNDTGFGVSNSMVFSLDVRVPILGWTNT